MSSISDSRHHQNSDIAGEAPRAIVVGIQGTDTTEVAVESLHELRELAGTLEYDVRGEIFQRRETVHPAHYVGKGKLDEIQEMAAAEDATFVFFDGELNPRQVRNLEKLLELKVLDRSEIILSIFSRRAKTAQAKLQVELAKAQYELPRLRNMWTHFTRTEGRVGVRAGSGEKQLEEDLRATRRRIHSLKKSLQEIEERKQREVAQRGAVLTVSLVGYTNAGKSTLMNRLTRAGTLAEDKLFATLDTKTRVWEMAGGRRVLLSDTVGFVRKLPHHLVASFHATLEETLRADLLLHVVDASHEYAELQHQAVCEVLEEVGVEGIPIITVLNKADRVDSDLDLRALCTSFKDHVVVSATSGDGIDDLEARVSRWVDEQREDFEIYLPMREGRLLSLLSRFGTVLSHEQVDDDNYRIHVRMTWADIGRLRKEFGSDDVQFHRIAN